METSPSAVTRLGGITRQLAQRMLALGANRVELLEVEIQEAKVQLLQAAMVAVGLAVFSLLTGIALSVMVVMAFWAHSPVTALAILTGLYATAGGLLWLQFHRLRRSWKTFPATLEQLRKDCECLEENLN